MSNELREVSSDNLQTVRVCVVTIVTNTPLRRWQVRSLTSSTFYQCNKIRRGICTNAALLIREISHEKMPVCRALENIRAHSGVIKFN